MTIQKQVSILFSLSFSILSFSPLIIIVYFFIKVLVDVPYLFLHLYLFLVVFSSIFYFSPFWNMGSILLVLLYIMASNMFISSLIILSNCISYVIWHFNSSVFFHNSQFCSTIYFSKVLKIQFWTRITLIVIYNNDQNLTGIA